VRELQDLVDDLAEALARPISVEDRRYPSSPTACSSASPIRCAATRSSNAAPTRG